MTPLQEPMAPAFFLRGHRVSRGIRPADLLGLCMHMRTAPFPSAASTGI
eukprot:CAMPEP_0170445706 /NCGR_PEP_ID=MMETSP0117_2-20130122/49208_1 /TAXON_ID=400756 /ORGANISM="Durinskia baltica, Strain CSIRO CS-38" /LENGTH=48 /DNA_ID= /DNA_START= /DNA_END= /DNA_ORIENTATION=